MSITGTDIAYYHLCHRKAWLHANGIRMEHTSDLVADGKLTGNLSYPQRNDKHSEIMLSAEYKEIELHGKLDFYDSRTRTIHETKRSDAVEASHLWQVRFYLWLLELNGMTGAVGRIEYPKLRKTEEVLLVPADREHLEAAVPQLQHLVESAVCPPVINARICKSCAYYDFCYIQEAP